MCIAGWFWCCGCSRWCSGSTSDTAASSGAGRDDCRHGGGFRAGGRVASTVYTEHRDSQRPFLPHWQPSVTVKIAFLTRSKLCWNSALKTWAKEVLNCSVFMTSWTWSWPFEANLTSFQGVLYVMHGNWLLSSYHCIFGSNSIYAMWWCIYFWLKACVWFSHNRGHVVMPVSGDIDTMKGNDKNNELLKN